MKQKTEEVPDNCPECNTKTITSYNEPYQDEVNGKIWGGFNVCECPKCGWEGFFKVDFDRSGFSFPEHWRSY